MWIVWQLMLQSHSPDTKEQFLDLVEMEVRQIVACQIIAI